FSQKDGLKLALLGTLGAPESPFSFSSKGYPVILGSVYDCPFGQAVTLKDCQRVRYSTGVPGLSTEGYRADRAFFGRHLVRPEDFGCSTCRLSTSGLSGWAANISGFRGELGDPNDKSGWEFRITYTPPRPLEATIPGGSLGLYTSAGWGQEWREQS